jgi:hypothetical protein
MQDDTRILGKATFYKNTHFIERLTKMGPTPTKTTAKGSGGAAGASALSTPTKRSAADMAEGDSQESPAESSPAMKALMSKSSGPEPVFKGRKNAKTDVIVLRVRVDMTAVMNTTYGLDLDEGEKQSDGELITIANIYLGPQTFQMKSVLKSETPNGCLDVHANTRLVPNPKFAFKNFHEHSKVSFET